MRNEDDHEKRVRDEFETFDADPGAYSEKVHELERAFADKFGYEARYFGLISEYKCLLEDSLKTGTALIEKLPEDAVL